ncbi:MAG: hypothetical protein P8Y18_10555 [Candidatus Bathyarchaeota archaeon]
MTIVKKQGLLSRYFKLRTSKSILAIVIIAILIYLSWLFAFPQFGPILTSYLNGIRALSIEKGKWVLLFIASMTASNLITGLALKKTTKRIPIIIAASVLISLFTLIFWLNYMDMYLIAIPLGLAAGISPVAWGTYFTENVTPEERGRVAGIAIGLSMPIAQLFVITEPFDLFSTAENKVLIIGILILISFILLAFRSKNENITKKPKKSKGHPPKQIILYAIPVFLFSLVSGILLSIVFPTILGNISSGIFYIIWAIPVLIGAIIAGTQLDLRGRKFPTMVGLAITGISIALLAILNINTGYLFIIPLAIGFSFVLITSYIIWADVAPENAGSIFYGLGFALINSGIMLGLILTGTHFGSVSSAQINSYSLLAAILLFVSIPPLILAEEALPKALIEKRQLMEYLDGMKGRFSKKKEE